MIRVPHLVRRAAGSEQVEQDLAEEVQAYYETWAVRHVQIVHPPKDGLGAARGRPARGWLGVGARPGQGLEFHSQPSGLRTDGHNIFLYHHPAHSGGAILCDFGVKVTRTFETPGGYPRPKRRGELPLSSTARPYNRMDWDEKWMAANRRGSAGYPREIYGDPMPDAGETETTLIYLL